MDYSESIILFLLSFSVSTIISRLIIVTEWIHYEYTHDTNINMVHKHHLPVPRIGGIAILSGMIAGIAYLTGNYEGNVEWLWWLSMAATPVFLGGIIEDIVNGVSEHWRLLLSFISAAIIVVSLDLQLNSIGWEWFDSTILGNYTVSLILTIFMVGGITQATNIIDGFNGLLLGFSSIALIAIAYVLIQVNDYLLLKLVLVVLGSLLGLFLFNFPSGRIFTGDGGAYLIGFLLAVISLAAVQRNSEISPWLPLLIMIYPVVEVLFSIYRKKFLLGISPFSPDRAHLHILVYRRISRKLPGVAGNHPNSVTSMIIWLFSLLAVAPAIVFWNSPLILIICLVTFSILYILIYSKLSCYSNKQ